MTNTRPLLIAYDGSASARTAVEQTARLFPGAQTIVLYARQPLEGLAAHLEGYPALEELRRLDAATLDTSESIASEGAKYATELGLAAEGRVSSSMQTASAAIALVAEELDAAVVILGTRGRGGVRSALLGSTSTNVLHHTERPTLVIPSQDVVLDRQEIQRRN